jgi:hypothetical protein
MTRSHVVNGGIPAQEGKLLLFWRCSGGQLTRNEGSDWGKVQKTRKKGKVIPVLN